MTKKSPLCIYYTLTVHIKQSQTYGSHTNTGLMNNSIGRMRLTSSVLQTVLSKQHRVVQTIISGVIALFHFVGELTEFFN